MKYVIYYRVSTKRQGESGLGLEAQKRDVSLFLSHVGDYEIISEVTDVMSGKGMPNDRPQFKEAVELAEKEGATLLAAKPDRISRDVECFAHVMKRVPIKVANMPNADGFQLHLFASLAEQERTFISQRTKAALAVAKAKGTKLGGAATRRRVAAEKNYAKIQDRDSKYKGYLENWRMKGFTLQQVADAMNDMGITSPRGGIMTAKTVQRMCIRLGVL